MASENICLANIYLKKKKPQRIEFVNLRKMGIFNLYVNP